MNEKGFLAIKPIRFTHFGYKGNIGSEWINTEYILSKLFTQNIIYSLYREARTVDEVSNLLNAKSNLIEEIIEWLEDNGFVDKISNNKYITNMLIHDFSLEICEERHIIFNEYAKIICEEYIPLLLENINYPSEAYKKIYTPNNDLNFLMWSLVSLACRYKFINPEYNDNLKKFFILRKDGSEYISEAVIENDFSLSFDYHKFSLFNEMYYALKTYDKNYFQIWVCNSFFDNRKTDWSIFSRNDFAEIFDIFAGKLNNYQTNIKIIENLIKKGLIIEQNTDPDDLKMNFIISGIPKIDLLNMLPNKPEHFLYLNDKLSKEIYELTKSQYPPHLQGLCEAFYKNSLSSGDILLRVLDNLIKNNVLKPLSELQKQTVNMIMFSDVLKFKN